MLINIEQIKIENRIRKDFGNIQELADDIKQNGLINPPVVISESDGTYTLLTGERRVRAMKLLGYKQVEVRTWKSLDDEQKLNIEISENEARKDFSKSERMEYALKLAEIERLKAEERMKSGKADPTQTFAQFGGGGNISTTEGKVRDIVAAKTGRNLTSGESMILYLKNSVLEVVIHIAKKNTSMKINLHSLQRILRIGMKGDCLPIKAEF